MPPSGTPVQVYSACASVPIANSPFAQTPGAGLNSLPIASSTPTRLSDLFPSQAAFCNAFSANSFCYSGAPYVLPPPSPANATSGMCVEKIGMGTYINMAAIPGAPKLALVASQYGRVSQEVLGISAMRLSLPLLKWHNLARWSLKKNLGRILSRRT